jgi:hypothetical protein
MRQTKRAFDRTFSFIVFVLIGVSAITVFRDHIGSGISAYFPQESESQQFAEQQSQVEEKVEVIAQAQEVRNSPSVLQATTITSLFVNDRLVNPDTTVKYKDIGFQVETPDINSSLSLGEAEGGTTSLCALGGVRTNLGIAMQLKEAPVIPGFYYKGVSAGLPKREGTSTDFTQRIVATPQSMELTPEQMNQFCNVANDQFRTFATYGLEPPLKRQAPAFWKVCATQARFKTIADDASEFSKTWRETDKRKTTVAYKIGGYTSVNGLDITGGTKGIIGAPFAWAFDPPGRQSVAADATATALFNNLYPPTSDLQEEATSQKGKALARNSELLISFNDVPVLKAVLSGNGFILNDKDTQNVRLSYRPDRQENILCDITKGECPIIAAEAECGGILGSTYLNVRAKPGLVGFYSTPDFTTNASSEKAMQRAMTAAFSSMITPDEITKKASKMDIIRASGRTDVLDSSCNQYISSTPTQLKPEQMETLKKQFERGIQNEESLVQQQSPAIIFYKLKARFKGDIPRGGILGNSGMDFEGDVTVFTAIPLINLTSYSYYTDFADKLQGVSTEFKNKVLQESGMAGVDFRVKCSGPIADPKITLDLRNVR